MNTTSKRLLSLALTAALLLGMFVAFPAPKPAQAGPVLETLEALEWVKKGVGVLDSAVVKGLDFAAEKTGNNNFTKVANLLAMPFDEHDSRKIEQELKEIKSMLEDLSKDIKDMKETLDRSIAELSREISSTNLSDKRLQISSLADKCNPLITSYQEYIEASQEYIDGTAKYAAGDITESALKKLETTVNTRMIEYENNVKDLLRVYMSFEQIILTMAHYASTEIPSYSVQKNAIISEEKNNSDTNIKLANSLADKAFPFEHQKYDFIRKEMNWTVSEFSKILIAARAYAEYQEYKGGSDTDMMLARDALEKALNDGIYCINNIVEQSDDLTKNLMRPYDAEKPVAIDFLANSVYKEDRPEFTQGVTLEVNLKARDTAPVMDFYNVMPLGGNTPYLLLKYMPSGNASGTNKLHTDNSLIILTRQTIDFGAHFPLHQDMGSMDQDFYNLRKTADGKYTMLAAGADINPLLATEFYKLYPGIRQYLTNSGLKDLNGSMAYIPLNDWKPAGFQYAVMTAGHYYCYYTMLQLSGFDTDKPSKYEKEFRAKSYDGNEIQVILKGEPNIKHKLDFETNGVSVQGVSKGGEVASGTQLSVTLKASFYRDKPLTYTLRSADGRLLDIVFDMEQYDAYKNSSGNVEMFYTMPYQDCKIQPEWASRNQLLGISEGVAGEYLEKAELALEGEPVDGGDEPVAISAGAPVTFTDIQGHPAEEDINFLIERGLINSTASGTFGPDEPMTRAMFVTALARDEGVNPDKYVSSSFSDIAHDSWFRPYAEWAHKSGFIEENEDHEFRPNDPVTGAEIAQILTLYAESRGIEAPTGWDNAYAATGAVTRGETAQEIAAFIKAVADGVIDENDRISSDEPQPEPGGAAQPEQQPAEPEQPGQEPEREISAPQVQGSAHSVLIGVIILVALGIFAGIYYLVVIRNKS